MKLPKLFGKKRLGRQGDEGDPEHELDDEGPAGAGPRPSFVHEDEAEPRGGDEPMADDAPEDDGPEEDGDEREEGPAVGGRTLVSMAAGVAMLALGITSGLGWWFFSQPENVSAERPVAGGRMGTEARVAIPLPPPPEARGSATAGPTPAAPEAATAALAVPSMPAVPAGLPTSALAPPETGDLGPGQGIVVEAVARTAYGVIPDAPEAVRLQAEPLAHLQEKVEGLERPLPKANRGERPMLAYARPSEAAADRPRVAVVVTDIGLSRAAGIGVIGKVPADVTIAVDPYARDVDDWVVRARLSGHEVLLELPMESERFPMSDAGPLALSAGIQSEQNLGRLRQVMSRTSVYVGLLAIMGSKFNRADGQLKPVLTEIRDRGLMFVDGSTGRSAAPRIAAEIELPQAQVDVVLDETPTVGAITTELARLEAIARQKGSAVALARPYPTTVQRLAAWAETLRSKGLALVPITALADVQPVQ